MLVKLIESEKTLVRTTRAAAIKGIVHPEETSDDKYILSLFYSPLCHSIFLFSFVKRSVRCLFPCKESGW